VAVLYRYNGECEGIFTHFAERQMKTLF
jgi:hypothetical protein